MLANLTFPSFAPLSSSRGTLGQNEAYRNPLPVEIADPTVVFSDGVYYLYGTSAPSQGFRVWASTDLINWEAHPLAFSKTAASWGRDHFWAPCARKQRPVLSLLQRCRPREGRPKVQPSNLCCRQRFAVRPVRRRRAPLLDLGYAVIDADVFVDRDGRGYLYYSRDISENPVERDLRRAAYR